jgi:hypothetical protein
MKNFYYYYYYYFITITVDTVFSSHSLFSNYFLMARLLFIVIVVIIIIIRVLSHLEIIGSIVLIIGLFHLCSFIIIINHLRIFITITTIKINMVFIIKSKIIFRNINSLFKENCYYLKEFYSYKLLTTIINCYWYYYYYFSRFLAINYY